MWGTCTSLNVFTRAARHDKQELGLSEYSCVYLLPRSCIVQNKESFAFVAATCAPLRSDDASVFDVWALSFAGIGGVQVCAPSTDEAHADACGLRRKWRFQVKNDVNITFRISLGFLETVLTLGMFSANFYIRKQVPLCCSGLGCCNTVLLWRSKYFLRVKKINLTWFIIAADCLNWKVTLHYITDVSALVRPHHVSSLTINFNRNVCAVEPDLPLRCW